MSSPNQNPGQGRVKVEGGGWGGGGGGRKVQFLFRQSNNTLSLCVALRTLGFSAQFTALHARDTIFSFTSCRLHCWRFRLWLFFLFSFVVVVVVVVEFVISSFFFCVVFRMLCVNRPVCGTCIHVMFLTAATLAFRFLI